MSEKNVVGALGRREVREERREGERREDRAQKTVVAALGRIEVLLSPPLVLLSPPVGSMTAR